MYRAPPSSLKALAAQVVNRCINAHRGDGGFGTFEIKNSVSYVVNPEIDLEEPFRKTFFPLMPVAALLSKSHAKGVTLSLTTAASTAFLTVSLTNIHLSIPEPGNFNPTVAQTLGDEVRDVVHRYVGEAHRKLAVRNGWFRARASQMRTGGRTTPWWGRGLEDKRQAASESLEPTAIQTATTGPSSVIIAL